MAIIARDPAAAGRGGSRLNRSETVTVRLDPKLNYLCELGARAQRRTKSSFIEWAIEHALSNVYIPGTSPSYGQSDQTIAELAEKVWDVDEADRLIQLAFGAPVLLTHEEQLMWKAITRSGYFWYGQYGFGGSWSWSVRYEKIIWERVREKWPIIKGIATGENTIADLPTVALKSPAAADDDDGKVLEKKGFGAGFDDDLDDDVPF